MRKRKDRRGATCEPDVLTYAQWCEATGYDPVDHEYNREMAEHVAAVERAAENLSRRDMCRRVD